MDDGELAGEVREPHPADGRAVLAADRSEREFLRAAVKLLAELAR